MWTLPCEGFFAVVLQGANDCRKGESLAGWELLFDQSFGEFQRIA
jgi:hypothetical protein